MSTTPVTRRSFIRQAAAGAIAFPMVSSLPVLGANQRLNLASVGVGGKGWTDLNKVSSENIVGVCDVDAGRLAQATRQFPKAKGFADWRAMYDALGNGFDGVTVSTPDHMHFPPAMAAIGLKRHVFCQKPLTHTVEEARRLTLAARKAKVATQMGNQAMAHGPLRREAELIRGGALGTVREVHLWTDRPGSFWRQGINRPESTATAPSSLSWDLWLGVAPKRPYAPGYHPFAWRGFWDFGTGALGDMGCHLFNLLALAFEIRDPISVEAESAGGTVEAAPLWSRVTYQFPAVHRQPAMKVVWYDGGMRPASELVWGAVTQSNGVIVVGSRDTLVTSYEGGGRLLSGTPLDSFRSIPETFTKRTDWEQSHYDEWIHACKGGPVAASNFEVSGPVTEAVLLGNIALRTGKKVRWDSKRMRTGDAAGDALLKKGYPGGWRV
jgi:predicted dehydrogenase